AFERLGEVGRLLGVVAADARDLVIGYGVDDGVDANARIGEERRRGVVLTRVLQAHEASAADRGAGDVARVRRHAAAAVAVGEDDLEALVAAVEADEDDLILRTLEPAALGRLREELDVARHVVGLADVVGRRVGRGRAAGERTIRRAVRRQHQVGAAAGDAVTGLAKGVIDAVRAAV